ncbi:MAG: outer membrane beta-barrel protein [Alphaproteobacteria bacterium]|nr:outer membrane beta-barrel protein [Alphaproteobacteria bacterium]
MASAGGDEDSYEQLSKRPRPRYYPGPPGVNGSGRDGRSDPAGPDPEASNRGFRAPATPAAPVTPAALADLRPALAPMVIAPPVAAALASLPDQTQRAEVRSDDDPFGAVGDRAGSFLIKGAVEVGAGYDSNPARLSKPVGAPVFQVAPELVVMSDWDRHALVADLRGAFTGYGNAFPDLINGRASPEPTSIDRPSFNGHVDGRIDVTRDLRLTSQLRMTVGTDNPGSANIQPGLAAYPIYTTTGASVGIDRSFNRLDVSLGATADRTRFTQSRLSDGGLMSNDDRNYNQFGGVGRVSYEVNPGLKPFVEVEGDSREHDLNGDRNGYRRDSSGGYAKAGTSLDVSRILTGEVSIGYASRTYVDPRLPRLQGMLTTASLVWSASPLTTVKLLTDTQIAETTLPASSGTMVRTYAVEVDHDFRRWLTGIGKLSYGTFGYQNVNRNDELWSVEGDLIYKLNRNVWLKTTLRHDILNSNVPGASARATVVMLGVRLQN